MELNKFHFFIAVDTELCKILWKAGYHMESMSTLFNQIIMMFLLMGFGYYAYKKQWITDVGSSQISNILLKICVPIIIINAFYTPFSYAKLYGLGISFVLSIFAILLSLGVGKLFYRSHQQIEIFCCGFSNAGFMGIPLVIGLFGQGAVFYLSSFLMAFYLLAWSIGLLVLTGRKELIQLKTLIYNPATIGLAIGLCIFFLQIPLPIPIAQGLSKIADMNTPLAMIVLGSYIAKNHLLSIFQGKMPYHVSFVRLIVVPMILIVLFMGLPSSLNEMKSVILIASSAPVGVMVAMLAQQYDHDFVYGAKIVSLSTILSLLTMPLMLLIANLLW